MYHTFYVNGSAVTVPRMNSDVYIGGSAGQINIAPISAHMIYSLNKGDVVTVFASAYNASAVYRVYTGQSAFFGYLIG